MEEEDSVTVPLQPPNHSPGWAPGTKYLLPVARCAWTRDGWRGLQWTCSGHYSNYGTYSLLRTLSPRSSFAGIASFSAQLTA